MKKTYLLIATAALVFAGCANDEYIGSENAEQTKGEIMFAPTADRLTRGTLFGEPAADKLSKHFVVYGAKHVTGAEDKTDANDALVFNQYNVLYNGKAGSTQTNAAGWEYVGQTSYSAATTSQTIKYWDYAANNGYTFYGFSAAPADIHYPQQSGDNVIVNKTTADASGTVYTKGYEMTVKPAADKSKIYFSDRAVVPESQFGKTVSLTFRNMGAKVRVGFYETIPGYSVEIDNFRIDDDASAAVTSFAAMKDAYSTGFAASLQNVKTSVAQTLKVTYYDATNPITENRPTVSNPSAGYDYTLKLGGGVVHNTLSTSTANPTWDKTGGAYTDVFPFEANNNPMILKLDFTMTAEDGSGEKIHVKGARAVVPAEYVQWKSNFAYTYIFKISDKTNGTTGEVDGNDDPTDPEGLKPITFDACVVDAATDWNEQFITTVETNSITTYQEGVRHETDNEYKQAPIYVVNSEVGTNAVITPSAIGTAATQAQVYKVTTTGDVITESSVFAKLLGSANGLTLTAVSPAATIESNVPFADGTNPAIKNVKFTPDAAGTYAYVYTKVVNVPATYTLEAAANTYDGSKTYYMLSTSGVYYAVTVPNAAAYAEHKANLYQVNTPGTPGQYDIKVIKVE